MAKDVLLEIGTEELPVEFIPIGLEQLTKLAKTHLNKEKIQFQKIETYATPCRLILWVIGVAEKQIAGSKEVRGPAKDVAFDSQGKPTAQAIGFAKAQGLKVADLVIKEVDARKYTFAVHKTNAEATKKILKILLPTIIRSLTFPKMMRWNSRGISFARPIRWILALWGKVPIRFEFGGIKSSNSSYGHRYLNPTSFKVKDTKSFRAEFKKRYCLISPEERINIIEKKGNALVKKFGGKISSSKQILEEISNFVEYPLCLLGKFSAQYLKIPEEILIAVIEKQEKCLSVKSKNGKLLPLFVIVANRKDDRSGFIKKGYERVMEARFNDAQFFYRDDLDRPLSERVEGLKEIIFQEDLGTLFDKAQRLEMLADYFSAELKLSHEDVENLKKAAKLCKADLLTEVVGEFPDLQGYMGRYYTSVSGEKKEVGEAIFEHYLPRFPGDILPKTKLGALLGIFDRIDTLLGYFYLGLIPSGSEDPYSLRRQANGLVEIILKFELALNLGKIIDESAQLYKFDSKENFKKELSGFLRQRLIFILEQKGYSPDFIEAVLAGEYSIMPEILQKLEVLKQYSQKKDFPKFLKAYQRLNNILKSVPDHRIKSKTIDKNLVEEDAEKALFESFSKLKTNIKNLNNFQEVPMILNEFTPFINKFFDEVMVMDPDENLRTNRLLILQEIRKLFLNFADFSLIK